MAIGSSEAPQEQRSNIVDAIGGVPSWGLLAADDLEQNELLKFPMSIVSYQKMLDTDAQCQGLAHGSTWPLYRMKWFIRPGDARADGVERISRDLCLPLEGEDQPQRKTKNRFNFSQFLEEALDAIFLGFKVFEQVAPVGEDGWVHYKKLVNVPGLSIAEMKQEPDGGIAWIKQHGTDMPKLPIERLVWYAFQKRGANWTGKSMFRGCFGPHLLKDRAMRIGVMNLQRAGVGTPVIEAPPGATDAELIILNRLAERWNANSKSGGAIPAGGKLRLVGVEGSQPDAIGFAKLMNEEMARAFLQMFMQAGQTGTGSRSTTEAWIDWHKLTLEYIATWFAKIFNEHVIEDDWEWNYGEEEDDVPVLAWEWDEVTDAGAEAAEDPKAELRRQVANDEIDAPEEVQAWLNTEQGRTARGSRRTGHRRRGGTRAAGANSTAAPPLSLPGRTLRRQPYTHEITAAVDYAAIDSAFDSALDLLAMEARTLQRYQIDQLHDAIVEANGDMTILAELDVEPFSADVIHSRLMQVASLAAGLHVEEANRQGVTIPRPDTDLLKAALMNRAEAVDSILANDLAQRASRNAVRLSGGALAPDEVAAAVVGDLNSRSDAYTREILGGAVQQAINDGRGLVMSRSNPSRIYASELLDNNTCPKCVGKDGTEYESVTSAARDYPSGGYKDCEGREKCRGVLVAVYDETAPEA
jgi:hypothetical protein